jgi:hypothetical protein
LAIAGTLELTLTEELYGEIDERHVDPEIARAARSALDFCCARFGGDDVRIRWLRRGDIDYHCAKILDCLRKLSGEEVGTVDRSYEKIEAVRGFVRQGLRAEERSKAIFLAVENDPDGITRTVAHEFYHLKYSPFASAGELADEVEAERFGERVVKLMAAEAREEFMDRWRQRYAELTKQ